MLRPCQRAIVWVFNGLLECAQVSGVAAGFRERQNSWLFFDYRTVRCSSGTSKAVDDLRGWLNVECLELGAEVTFGFLGKFSDSPV